jgi:hypothetical protein
MKTCGRILSMGLVCLLGFSGLRAADDAPKLKVTTRKADDTVRVQEDGGNVTFVVKSPSGIGDATIERTEEKWPATVLLKFHLQGLESLVISTGKVKLQAAVSAQNDKGGVRLWKDDKEAELLDAKSPLWMEIRLVGAEGKTVKETPRKDRCFEMTLPKALLEGDPKSLTVTWIDFYRR